METDTNHATLSAIFAALRDAVCLADADGVVTYVNRAGVRLGLDKVIGLGPREQIPALDVRDAAGGVLAADAHPLARALATRAPVGDVPLRIGTPPREVRVDAIPLVGTPSGGVLVIREDVTMPPGGGREELQAAREAAEEASRLKDQFIAALSHELRAPLQPILGWTEVLRRHGKIDDITARALEAIRRNIRQQVRLVDDLLDLSRIVHRKLALRYESFDLREHLRVATDPFEEAAALKRVRLTLDLPAGPVVMWGDGSRVQQIAANLISNAVKFTPPGGRIRVAMRATDNTAVLQVEDTGEGIAPDDLDVIFDAFRQGHGGRRKGGLGLGLDLVRRLAELHGGSVSAWSEGPGRGARFEVRLPLGLEKELVADREPPDGRRLDHRKIVIVEDNDDTRQVLRYMLELEGALVETAASGEEALRVADALQPHAMLCDIGLPDIDGLEVARRIRARCGSDAPRLIALTGYGQADDIRQALAAGFDAHLTKPVNLQELLGLLAAVPG